MKVLREWCLLDVLPFLATPETLLQRSELQDPEKDILGADKCMHS